MNTVGRIESLGARGEGVLRIEDRVAFVPGALPNELVRYEILVSEKRYDVGRLLEILEVAPERREPLCHHDDRVACQSCALIPADPSAVAGWKTELLRHRLLSAGFPDAVAAPISLGESIASRTFARFSVVKGGHLGIRSDPKSPGKPAVGSPIDHPNLERMRRDLDGRVSGAKDVALRVSANTGERLASFYGSQLPKALDPVTFDGVLVGYDGKTYRPYKGLPWYHEELFGRRFRISAPTFLLPSTRGLELLAETVRSTLGTSLSAIWCVDAAQGWLPLSAAATAERIVLSETNVWAVDDLRSNVGEDERVSLRVQEGADMLSDLTSASERASAILATPTGGRLSADTIAAMLEASADRLIVLGDDAPGLVHDVRRLTESWRLERVLPVDLMPGTPQLHHVAVFNR